MNLFVGNLSSAVQPADLQHIFGGMGQILYAKLAAADAAGEAGYAYVYVPNDEQARSAVASLDGTELKGARLRVSPLSERPGVIGGARR
jgi:cold-inducible RNA-binding protein